MIIERYSKNLDLTGERNDTTGDIHRLTATTGDFVDAATYQGALRQTDRGSELGHLG